MAPGTSSAHRSPKLRLSRLPIRWRLAAGSAAATFVILCGFAGIVGVLTARTVRSEFNERVRQAADALATNIEIVPRRLSYVCTGTNLADFALAERAQIRVYDRATGQLYCTNDPDGPDFSLPTERSSEQNGYRVEARAGKPSVIGDVVVAYARPLSDINHTIAKLVFFLVIGVSAGTLLAFAAGWMVARRAMTPVAELTAIAGEIERTRDPARRLPHPDSDDEVAELARTLDRMLRALDAARGETEATLERQREFVADASHELRTPLTSVLANLELLAETLDGEQREAADSALRSSQRMRRLVGDLLLLARADAGRERRRVTLDLGGVLVEAAAEVGPLAGDHDLMIDASPAPVCGVPDELHRLVVNLLENALRHTPPGAHVRGSTALRDGSAVLVVEDDGPGIPADQRDHVFNRFVRGARDSGGGGTGLGLAIVRAVAQAHGGSVVLEDAQPGARFVITLPAEVGAPAPAAAS